MLKWSREGASQQIPPMFTMAQSHPDLNLTETLWEKLKRTIHERMPANLNNWSKKELLKEEWAKIPPQWCKRIQKTSTSNYCCKHGSTSFCTWGVLSFSQDSIEPCENLETVPFICEYDFVFFPISFYLTWNACLVFSVHYGHWSMKLKIFQCFSG